MTTRMCSRSQTDVGDIYDAGIDDDFDDWHGSIDFDLQDYLDSDLEDWGEDEA